ncbi:hydantoinase/oxoprolinase family protein [Streptomyces mayonensis]|uniref:hydantoinase/oxoprolinase family protein n=1 Tax=Streptomyces mayonensis TaxID=2750816 RepID=UPI001C1E3891|nr:hydantoinase/oxoprolinase family protein [Streptomyces sp. A108]MBU6530306.1 hydantoinase/oxoprolinase family protein [Streptomyces sp. A108]
MTSHIAERGAFMRIGVECGGTFTDLVVLDDTGALRATAKVHSTPDDPSLAVIEALDRLPADLREEALLLHGSTVATNALLERRGPRLGLLVTRGFRDLLTLQRQDRDRMYDLRYVKPSPLVPRHLVREVDERITAAGEVAVALDDESVRHAVKELLAQDVTAIAVCLLHSYGNPAHERRVAELIASVAPDLPVSLSCSVAREFREYERTSTTAVDAFVRPAVAGYLSRLSDQAARRGITGLQVMQSNAGAVPVPVVTARPVTLLLSGPAAGVSGAVAVAEAGGLGDVVTMDMGGTSTDVALVVDGAPRLTPEVTVDGLPVRVPMVDITTVGAGGGSVVGVDSGGLLTVGPRSAGSRPGPACYGHGGELPTITDADAVLGLLGPRPLMAGRFALDLDAASAVFAPLAARLGRTVGEVAWSAHQLANVAMAGAIRVASVERGHDPRGLTLLAYGGAGPLHAAGVADELGMSRVVVAPHAGLASAYGLLVSGFRREFARTVLVASDTLDAARLRTVLDSVTEEAHAELAGQGVDPGSVSDGWSVDMRYAGQGFELSVPLPDDGPDRVGRLTTAFHELHARRFGHADPHAAVQVVTLRLSVTRPRPSVALPEVAHRPGAVSQECAVLEQGAPGTAVVLPRTALAPGATAAGPAIVTDDSSTAYVPSGWTATVDRATNLVLTRS